MELQLIITITKNAILIHVSAISQVKNGMCGKDFYYYKQKIVIKIVTVTVTATATSTYTTIYKVAVWLHKCNCKSYSHKNNMKQISLL